MSKGIPSNYEALLQGTPCPANLRIFLFSKAYSLLLSFLADALNRSFCAIASRSCVFVVVSRLNPSFCQEWGHELEYAGLR